MIPYKLDPVKFLKYGIKYGSYVGYENPVTSLPEFKSDYVFTSTILEQLLLFYFKISDKCKQARLISIQSENVANIAKFVIKKEQNSYIVMDWMQVNG